MTKLKRTTKRNSSKRHLSSDSPLEPKITKKPSSQKCKDAKILKMKSVVRRRKLLAQKPAVLSDVCASRSRNAFLSLLIFYK